MWAVSPGVHRQINVQFFLWLPAQMCTSSSVEMTIQERCWKARKDTETSSRRCAKKGNLYRCTNCHLWKWGGVALAVARARTLWSHSAVQMVEVVSFLKNPHAGLCRQRNKNESEKQAGSREVSERDDWQKGTQDPINPKAIYTGIMMSPHGRTQYRGRRLEHSIRWEERSSLDDGAANTLLDLRGRSSASGPCDWQNVPARPGKLAAAAEPTKSWELISPRPPGGERGCQRNLGEKTERLDLSELDWYFWLLFRWAVVQRTLVSPSQFKAAPISPNWSQ